MTLLYRKASIAANCMPVLACGINTQLRVDLNYNFIRVEPKPVDLNAG